MKEPRPPPTRARPRVKRPVPGKRFVRADDLVRDAFRLAGRVYASGFRPRVLLSLWRGGASIGLAVDEFFRFKGLRVYHGVVRVESYRGIENRREPVIHGMPAVLRRIPRHAPVLIVDDIFDTGGTMQAVLRRLAARTRRVRVATVFLKVEGASDGTRPPDYYVRRTDRWVVFPHEIMDLSRGEIRRKSRELDRLLFGRADARRSGSRRVVRRP